MVKLPTLLVITTDGHIVNPAWVRGGFKGISRVMPRIWDPYRVEGFETVMPVLCWSLVCSIYRTSPTLTAFFDGTSYYDEPGHLFDQFPTFLRMVLSLFVYKY